MPKNNRMTTGLLIEEKEVSQQDALLKTGALQNAIINSENFSSTATDENGVIQIFNIGAERMLGYAAADVTNKFTRTCGHTAGVPDNDRAASS